MFVVLSALIVACLDQIVQKPPVLVSIDSATQGGFQVSGYFEKEIESLDLSWKTDWSNSTWNLTFKFAKSENSYNLSEISLLYELDNLSGCPTLHILILFLHLDLRYASNNRSLFSVTIGSYYSCQAEQNIVLNHSTPNPVTVKLTLSQLRVQAFRHGLEPEFNGIMVQCLFDYHLDRVVPIVIGISLAVMIIVALIAFIITSRRNRNISGSSGSGGYQQI
ncbi:lysosomal-associated membrane protein 1/2 [Schistosoma bovis]|uniref:Lysosome-associated membrane glycoprotein 5 n=1 Tax=Schistosoma bovis TaxID=6184 RepID=A0A430QD08_SCHBO|nr:lysosomal-associated membrane protein 1/2 [Schistosoma bovis]